MGLVINIIIALACIWYGIGGEKRMSMICTFRKLYRQAKEELRGKPNEEKTEVVDNSEQGCSDGVADTTVATAEVQE